MKSTPRGHAPNQLRKAEAFTLVEILIVVGIIAVLTAIAVPAFYRARQRAVAAQVRNELRLIDAAVEQYAIDTGKKSGTTVEVTDWTNYFRSGTRLYTTGEDPLGNDYGPQIVDEPPFVPVETYYELGSVVDDDFWEPFNP